MSASRQRGQRARSGSPPANEHGRVPVTNVEGDNEQGWAFLAKAEWGKKALGHETPPKGGVQGAQAGCVVWREWT